MSGAFRNIMIIVLVSGLSAPGMQAQKLSKFRIPDSGQTGSFTSTPGEDADFLVNPPSFTDNGNGTITDNNTGLMWQKTDGGEMTYENAGTYCSGLTLGGYNDWRLPNCIELFSINNYQHLNPALNTEYFPLTNAEYWWTSEARADDPTMIWVVNAGGGIGAHPKSETHSAGGTKYFNTRAVRSVITTSFPPPHFIDNGDGTIKDNYTGLTWQKIQAADSMSWEGALLYSKTVSLGGKSDWRLPNVKEIQSLNDVSKINPSFDNTRFPDVILGNFWSSTTLIGNTARAWDINVDFGIVSYSDKTKKEQVLLVRGGLDNAYTNITEVNIPGGEYEMGDHNGHYDPSHPNDEIPIHTVKIDSFNMAKTETTNEQYLTFLNSALLAGNIQVTSNRVHFTGDTVTIYYTWQDAPYYSIGYDGTSFSMADFRAQHPVNGVMWIGAIAYCNWLSQQNGLNPCYDLASGNCTFSNNGYRLPTEAEWEYAGRGGHTNPYLKFENGNTVDISQANLPNSGDPYETGDFPLTTPSGFYDGGLKQKSDYNWPGSATTYQTGNGINGFGLYDMQGNVWEFVNDWYASDYYYNSPYDNPTGPSTGSIMPDGKPYRGTRGGNWYNGIDSNNVNDGHSRVSNRDPSYFRGPQDPYHPWYHVGFRVARKYSSTTGINETGNRPEGNVLQAVNYPNPFSLTTTIRYYLPEASGVIITISNAPGREVATLRRGTENEGWHTLSWAGGNLAGGIYFCRLVAGNHQSTIKMILIK